MNIILKNIKIEINSEKENLEFAKLYENSYKEAIKKQTLKEIEKINWSAVFEIEYENTYFEFLVKTEGNYLTYLDLDGYLNGEALEVEDGAELHLVSKESNILEAFTFMEIKKLEILPNEKIQALEYSLFPKFAKGYIANDLKEDSNVKDFMEIFSPILSQMEIIKKYSIDCTWLKVEGGSEELQERFREFIEGYMSDELFFVYYDREYGEMLSKLEYNQLLMAGTKYNPTTEIVDIYE